MPGLGRSSVRQLHPVRGGSLRAHAGLATGAQTSVAKSAKRARDGSRATLSGPRLHTSLCAHTVRQGPDAARGKVGSMSYGATTRLIPGLLLLGFCASAGCTGSIEGPLGAILSEGDPSTPDAQDPAPSNVDLRDPAASPDTVGGGMPLRSLTRAEYNNTVAALLGDTSAPALPWTAEIRGENGFLQPRPISDKEVSEYIAAATTLADRFKTKLATTLGCDVKSAGEEACAKFFVLSFGRKAFRRPLAEDEASDFMGLWTTLRKTHTLSFEDAIGLVVEGMLQSPSFMYHWELGAEAPDADAKGLVSLTSYELASRLSYFLTQSPPDDTLAAAADSGAVLQPSELKAQAERLMATDKAQALFQDFIAQLLNVSDFGVSNDPLQQAMDSSRRAFVHQAVWSGGATPQELLLGSKFFLNEELAKLYAVAGVSGQALVPVTMDPTKRFGLLTHADYLAKTGAGNESLPPRRGRAIWENLLCGSIPEGVPAVPPEIVHDPGDTTREHFEKKVETLACASACHAILDYAGFAFENYGGPEWRDTDPRNGKPINASGLLKLPFGGKLSYTGPRDFTEGLVASEELQQCFARQMFRLAIGRADAKGDIGAERVVYDAYKAAALDLKALAVSVVSAKAFSTRLLNEGEVSK